MAAPSAPTNVVGTVDSGQSSVSFTPGADGGQPITSFTVTATDTTTPANGGQTATGTASPITITGLANGDGYTFTVKATNATGTSPASAPSALVIPNGTAQDPTPDPYPGSLQFPLTKPVNVVQLTDELSDALVQTVQVAVGGYDFTAGPISASNPATVWITPNTVSSTTVQNTINAHAVDPNYGTPASITEFNAVMQKVVANYEVTLSAGEIQTAVKGLLLRYSTTSTVPTAMMP